MKIMCSSDFISKIPAINIEHKEQNSVWFAKKFRSNNREHILFTESKTRFSLCLPAIRKKDYEHLEIMFFGEFIYSFEFYGYELDQKVLDYFGGLDFTEITEPCEIVDYQCNLINELPLLLQKNIHEASPSWIRLQLNRRVDY